MTSEVTCDGAPLTVATAPGNGGNNWGAVQVVDSGPLVLVSLEYAVHDDTANILLADEILSHGRAHLQQADDTMTCVVASESAALRDVLPPGMPLPSGTALHDLVTSTLTAVVVPRP